MSDIPDHCPYRRGDRVQMHGYPGHEAGHQQTGFRGTVDGFLGGTILTGATTDGTPWAEYWGALAPEGTPCHEARCGCCPHPGRACQPDQACADRGRRAAEALREWRRTGRRPALEHHPDDAIQPALF